VVRRQLWAVPLRPRGQTRQGLLEWPPGRLGPAGDLELAAVADAWGDVSREDARNALRHRRVGQLVHHVPVGPDLQACDPRSGDPELSGPTGPVQRSGPPGGRLGHRCDWELLGRPQAATRGAGEVHDLVGRAREELAVAQLDLEQATASMSLIGHPQQPRQRVDARVHRQARRAQRGQVGDQLGHHGLHVGRQPRTGLDAEGLRSHQDVRALAAGEPDAHGRLSQAQLFHEVLHQPPRPRQGPAQVPLAIHVEVQRRDVRQGVLAGVLLADVSPPHSAHRAPGCREALYTGEQRVPGPGSLGQHVHLARRRGKPPAPPSAPGVHRAVAAAGKAHPPSPPISSRRASWTIRRTVACPAVAPKPAKLRLLPRALPT